MTKKRWSWLEQVDQELQNMRREVQRIDNDLEQLKPFALEYWRKDKRKQRLEQKIKQQSY